MPGGTDRWWRVKDLTDSGLSAKAIAEAIGVSESTVRRIRGDIRQVKASGGKKLPPGAWRDAARWISDEDWELVKSGEMNPETARQRWRKGQVGSS